MMFKATRHEYPALLQHTRRQYESFPQPQSSHEDKRLSRLGVVKRKLLMGFTKAINNIGSRSKCTEDEPSSGSWSRDDPKSSNETKTLLRWLHAVVYWILFLLACCLIAIMAYIVETISELLSDYKFGFCKGIFAIPYAMVEAERD